MKKGIICTFLLAALQSVQAGQTELLAAYAQLEDHINGVTTLSNNEINAQATIIKNNKGNAGDNATMINASFALVATYESVVGPLFENGATSANGGFTRTDTSNANKALAVAMLKVYQAIIDDAYFTWNMNTYAAALDGAKFESADYWPGAVTPPSDPNAIYSVQINASQLKAWGYPVDFMTEAARRPTGAYLAPGSIATVTVPAALVGKGFVVRVGAHVEDLSSKGQVKRIDRVSTTFAINSTDTLVANPLGGGIYIEVPYEVEEGLVTVQIKNAVRSPFYSNTTARQTTLQEWQNIERHHPGPWADFESDKFMMNVPTSWIYNYADPVTTMGEWDDAMDAVSDLQGLPLVRPKTVLYCQIDVIMDASVFSPGYPQSNHAYNPHSTFNGNVDNVYLNGPKFSAFHHLHELGHAISINKFPGELEAMPNLLFVPVHNRKFGVTLDKSFGRSMGGEGCGTVSRLQAALTWILSDEFRAGSAMTANDMKYQHRGWGKYVEIAGMFGWDSLGDFWKSVAVDYENGITYSKNSDEADSRILRMSRAAGVDLTPLIYFWGVHPNNAANLKAAITAEGLPQSRVIYDRLKYYQTKVPMSTSAFTAHYWNVDAAPIDNAWYTAMRTDWTSTLGDASVAKVQEIIDEYFPNGRPVESLPYFESFEDRSSWTQATDDNYDWRRISGGTLSGAAGPSGASDGDYYMYAEGHDAGDSYKTSKMDCVFNFGPIASASMTFDYHMFGAYIDYIAVDVHDGSSWTTDVWKKSGQQQTSSTDPWSSAVVDLSAFAGNSAVTIRFRTANLQWNSADPAIDNISVDGEVGSQPLPYAESFESGIGAWVQSTDDDFDWTLNSGDTVTGGTGPSGASDGNGYLYIEPHDDYGGHNKMAQMECLFDLSAVPSATLSFDYHMYGANIDYLAVDIFDGTSWTSDVWKRTNAQHASSESAWSNAVVDLTAFAGNDEVTIRFRAKEDYWHLSDIAIDNLRVEGPLPTLPYAESFEDGMGLWEQSTEDDYDWMRNTGGTDTAAAGPSGASDGNYYLYAEGHHDLGSFKTSEVHCVFNFSTVSAPELTFDYHMFGNYITFLSVDIHDGSAWTSNVWTKVGKQHASSASPWSNAMVDLSTFAGNDEVTIRFRTANGLWNAADPAIDNIQLVDIGVGAYDAWASTAFAGAPGGTDQTESGNPDNDRFNNQQEWALVLDPLVSDEPGVDLSLSNSNFTVIYDRRMDSGVSVYASWANSLTSTVWRVHGDGLTEESMEVDGDIETMAARIPLDEDAKFIQIQVED